MNPDSTILLVGIGGAGVAIARRVSRAYGDGLRLLLADTDAASGLPDEPFVLIGGNRLSGHGSGGDVVAARMAAEDSLGAFDEALSGVRLAVLVAGLGGGTGGGATLEAVKHLSDRGIPSIVFATTPFAFEGSDRQRNARGVMAMIADAANATFFQPLDRLVEGTDNMTDALTEAVDALAAGITLFWRTVHSPGYIRMDAERLRHVISTAGKGRFASFSLQGPNRAKEALRLITESPRLLTGSGPVQSILCGILAGDDLRLSEVGTIADGVRQAFGNTCHFDLATVNDEGTFGGRLSVVVMLFESNAHEDTPAEGDPGGKPKHAASVLGAGTTNRRGRFNNAEHTIWNGEDLDIPTFIRKHITLEF